MSKNTKPRPARIATSHNLQPGNLATVYDAISGKHEQYQVADVVERDGKARVRLVGFNFYVSASLIQEVRVNG